jgi:HEAT repeat protein
MEIYPGLENLQLESLIERFQSPSPDEKKYRADYYMEIAERICESEDGRRFLKQQVSHPDTARVRAALFALSEKSSTHNVVPLLLNALNDSRPLVVAEAIDGLRYIGYQTAMEQLVALISHPSPYVVGAALRFIGAFDRDRAIPLLLNALAHPHFIVRENACDAVGDLEAIEAMSEVTQLLDDPHPDVREAARTALEDLKGGVNSH